MNARLGFSGWQSSSGMGAASFVIDTYGLPITPPDYADNFFNSWMLLEASEKAFRDNNEVYRVARTVGPDSEEWTLIGRYRKVSAETRPGYYFGVAVMFSGDCYIDETFEYINAQFDIAKDAYLTGDVMTRELASYDITSFNNGKSAFSNVKLVLLESGRARQVRRGVRPEAREGYAAPATRLKSNIETALNGEALDLRGFSVIYARLDSKFPLEQFHVEPPSSGVISTRVTQKRFPEPKHAPALYRTNTFEQTDMFAHNSAQSDEGDLPRNLNMINVRKSEYADVVSSSQETGRLEAFLQSPALIYLLLSAGFGAISAIGTYQFVVHFLF